MVAHTMAKLYAHFGDVSVTMMQIFNEVLVYLYYNFKYLFFIYELLQMFKSCFMFFVCFL